MEDSYRVIGMMSGTSLDGLDICLARFTHQNRQWQFKAERAVTVEYDPEWQNRLRFQPGLTADKLLQLDHQYGKWLGHQVNGFLKDAGIDKNEIDHISSHGHTLFHQPKAGYTFQLGCGPEIAMETGIAAVTDFRRQDVALGGQGAPLVPIGDAMLFPQYDACLNLGGFANISYAKNNQRLAYDICPVNYVLNPLARKLGHEFDKGGSLARSGVLRENLLHQLDSLEYYVQPPPKSLGAEWVQQCIDPLLAAGETKALDLLRTFTEHAARQIGKVLNLAEIEKCLITGGGAYNTYLIERLKTHSQCDITIPDDKLVNFKEALIFAFLGTLKIRDEINVLSSVTGSQQDHSSGIVYRL